MNPAWTAGQLDFHGLGRRAVVGQFDEGTSSSDSGGLLLWEGAQRRHMLKRLAGGFVDHRDASQIEPSVESLIKQGGGWPGAMKTAMPTTPAPRG